MSRMRYVNWNRACAWATEYGVDSDESRTVEEAKDNLLFDMAYHGRVPSCEPIYFYKDFQCLYTIEKYRYHSVEVLGYYVGRAKAMAAYKAGTMKNYYVNASSFPSYICYP